jgi:DNA-binding transcriptional LysR family regulator
MTNRIGFREGPMEMHQVRYFLAVCEALNFTRAAESCHVSQPSLTQAIKKLEEELGGALFRRERKGVFLTDLGEALHPSFEQILGEAQSVRETAHHLLNLKKAPLTVGVLETVGPLLPTRFLSAFKTAHQGLEVELVPAGHLALLAKLLQGAVDLVLTSIVEPLEPSFQQQTLYRESYVVIFPPGHRFRRYAQVQLKDLSGEPYVDRLACEMRDAVLRTCHEMKVELYATHRSSNEIWVQAMVLAGMGFAFMPEYSVALAGLEARPLVDPVVARQVALVTRADRVLAPAAELFLREAARHPWIP